tara:strand:+ start:159 stop:317 length:159 start_codon:yes stop_codon:yes gene_type:complete
MKKVARGIEQPALAGSLPWLWWGVGQMNVGWQSVSADKKVLKSILLSVWWLH